MTETVPGLGWIRLTATSKANAEDSFLIGPDLHLHLWRLKREVDDCHAASDRHGLCR